MNSNSSVGKIMNLGKNLSGMTYDAMREWQLKHRRYPIDLEAGRPVKVEVEVSGEKADVYRFRMGLNEAFERIVRLENTNFGCMHLIPSTGSGVASDEPFYGRAVDTLRRLQKVHAKSINLQYADISNLVFEDFPFEGVLAQYAYARGLHIEGSISESDFRGANLSGAKLIGPKTRVRFQGEQKGIIMDEKTDLSGKLLEVFLPYRILEQTSIRKEDENRPVSGILTFSNPVYHLERTIVPMPTSKPIQSTYVHDLEAKVS